MNEPAPYYRVVVAHAGCQTCQHGTFWTIVYVDDEGEDVEIGTSWGDEELATDICELMNMAYEAGVEKCEAGHEKVGS